MDEEPRLEERIIRAAERLFAEEGFAATGMRAIATVSKVSIGAIYHHFANKEDILEQIVRDEVMRRKDFLKGLQERELSLQQQIQELVNVQFGFLEERNDAARLFFRERFDPSPSLGTRIGELYEEVAGYIAEIIEKGITAGEIRPCSPLLTAYEMLGMIDAVSMRALESDETATRFRDVGAQDLVKSLWLWLQPNPKGARAYAQLNLAPELGVASRENSQLGAKGE